MLIQHLPFLISCLFPGPQHQLDVFSTTATVALTQRPFQMMFPLFCQVNIVCLLFCKYLTLLSPSLLLHLTVGSLLG